MCTNLSLKTFCITISKGVGDQGSLGTVEKLCNSLGDGGCHQDIP